MRVRGRGRGVEVSNVSGGATVPRGRGGAGGIRGRRNQSNERRNLRSSQAVTQGGGTVGDQVMSDPIVDNPTSSSSNVKCGLCDFQVGGDSIGCDKCSSWFHPSTLCTGLRALTLDCIANEGGEAIRFVCSKCRCAPQVSNSPSNSNDDGSTPISQLFQIVQSLAVTVTNLSKQVSVLLANSSQQPLACNNLINREDLYIEMREFEERKKRGKSVIVKGVDVGNENEFRDVFQELCNFTVGEHVAVEETFCINRERKMYRVKLQNKEAKISLLTNANKLKNSENFSRVYISRDLTYIQRQELSQKRAAARQADNPNFIPIGPIRDDFSRVPNTSIAQPTAMLASSQSELQNFH